MEEEQFLSKQCLLLGILERAKGLLEDLQTAQFNLAKYALRYPHSVLESDLLRIKLAPITTNSSRPPTPLAKREPGSEAPALGLHILGPSPEMLQHGLLSEAGSLARVLGGKLGESRSHLDRLRARLLDRTCRILVTGDVNAGKSTFVNALLGHAILPTDQQPCTQSFCEVVPSEASGAPTVEAFADFGFSMEEARASLSQRMGLGEMQDAIQEDDSPYSWYRLFWPVRVSDGTGPRPSRVIGSFLDVSLIDSPGLNSDTFKTAELFSRQQDIDVIVFLVNAANHLTLSAQAFLARAGQEKTFIFVVVNKFDEITNKDKCRRLILQQIGAVSPATGREASQLVHFVSAAEQLRAVPAGTDAFHQLEAALGHFMLERRTQSKLLPAYTYLDRLLADLDVILVASLAEAREDLDHLETDLALITPCYEQLAGNDQAFRADLQRTVTQASQQAYEDASRCLGELVAGLDAVVRSAPWRGFLGLGGFQSALRAALDDRAAASVRASTDLALGHAAHGLHQMHALALSHARQVFGGPGDLPRVEEEGLRPGLLRAHGLQLPEWRPTAVLARGWRAAGLLGGRTPWLGASTLAAAFLGYRPLLSLAVDGCRVLLLLSARRSGRWLLAGALGLGGLLGLRAVWTDLEHFVRGCLVEHYREALHGADWPHEHARWLEGRVRGVLVERSLALVVRFEEVLHRQRHLRAEKDLEVRQAVSVLDHFASKHQRLAALRREIQQLAI